MTRARAVVGGLILTIALLVLTGCSVSTGFGVRLNSDETVDVVRCDGFTTVERIDTVDNWEVVSVFEEQVRHDELVAGEWVWRTSMLAFEPNRPCPGLASWATPVNGLSPTAAVGVIIAFAFAVLPVVAVALLARANARHRASNRGERLFWFTVAPYVAALALVAGWALTSVLSSGQGQAVILAAVLSLPSSVVPSVLYSTTMHLLFSDAEWAAYGYRFVISIYLVGLVPWALLPIVGTRRLAQRPIRLAA